MSVPAGALEEAARFDVAISHLVAAGVDVEEVEHLDVVDVVLPLEVFEDLVAGYCAHRGALTDG